MQNCKCEHDHEDFQFLSKVFEFVGDIFMHNNKVFLKKVEYKDNG